jgi:DNA-directed RNA polymerase specialized sigma24 family protein
MARPARRQLERRNPRLIFGPYACDRHQTSTSPIFHWRRARYYGGDARAWLFTVMHNVHVSKIRRISAQPRAVKPYWSAEDSSLVDAPAFFRLIVRDVEGELQRMLEGMRQAVMLAAVSTDGYEVIATRLNNESWDVQIWAVSRAAATSYEILAVQRWVDDVLLTEMA